VTVASAIREMIAGFENENGSCNPDHAPFGVVIFRLGLDIAYLRAKLDDSSLSRFRDMVGAHQNVNGSHDLTTPISGMFCQPWSSTCYNQLM